MEGNKFLVIQSHVVWCLGAFFQSISGPSGEGGRITAAQEGLGLSSGPARERLFRIDTRAWPSFKPPSPWGSYTST